MTATNIGDVPHIAGQPVDLAGPAPTGTRVGHVHLKVADIECALGFYRDVLGFHVRQQWGTSAAFLAADDYHHDIALNTWESRGGQPPAPGTTGLFHLALLYPDRDDLLAEPAPAGRPR